MSDTAHSRALAKERLSSETWMPPWTRAEHEARYQFAAEYVRDKVVVDCACGNGIGSGVFLRRSPRFLFGIDSHPDAIVQATSKYASATSSFVCSDATALPLQSDSCDVFISLETIEHIDADRAFIAEAARVLRPGGTLICSTPNRLVTNPGAGASDLPWNTFHVREYALCELVELLGGQFSIEGVYGQNPNWPARVTALAWLGRNVSRLLAVRLNQMWKCRWFVMPHDATHAVRACDPRATYEYLVLVCRRKPRA